MADSPHAHFPVCRGDLDHVLGISSPSSPGIRMSEDRDIGGNGRHHGSAVGLSIRAR
jgi:hypothetical protein